MSALLPSDDLATCPFCGGQAVQYETNTYNPRHWIACRECHACHGDGVDSPAKAIAAWNRRTAPVGGYYCTDCECHISELHNGRCSCGSGRVVSVPTAPSREDVARVICRAKDEDPDKVLNDPCGNHLVAWMLEGNLADRILSLLGQTGDGWLPIESAPHNKAVLLGWRDWRDGHWCMEVDAATTGQRYGSGFSNFSQHGSATHWRPLPAPPAKEGRSPHLDTP